MKKGKGRSRDRSGESERQQRGATVIDVAARAGVSAMTVSRVINSQGRVKAETREAVEKAIAELAYVPNVAARSLVRSTELRIGVVYSNPSATFMSDFLTGVYEEASARGARLILVKGEGGQPPSEEALRELVRSGVLGVLVTPPLGESPRVLRILGEAGLPIAAVGAYGTTGVIRVRIDDRRAACEITRLLIGLGHRRIGFILGNPDQSASAERMAGFHDAVREVDGVETMVVAGDYRYESGLVAGEQLLGSDNPPSAIFASNDEMAAAVVSVAHRRQLHVPDELTVVGFDDTTAAVMLWPPLTTVHQPVHRLAKEALGLLVQEIASGGEGSTKGRDVMLDHEIVIRQSSAPPA